MRYLNGTRRLAAAALTAFLLLLGTPSAAEDLAPSGSDEAARRDSWVLSFTNNDNMHCRFHELEKGRLSLIWDVAPSTPVTVDLRRVDHAVREVPMEEKRPEDTEILRLRDGSVLYGKTLGFTPEAVEFEIAAVGRVSFKRKDVDELVRAPEGNRGSADPVEGSYVVSTTAGDRLIGELTQGADGVLKIKSEAIEATCSLEAVESISFPLPTENGDGKVVETALRTGPRPYTVALALQSGSRLSGTDPAISGGKLTLTLPGGQPVTVPVASIRELSFSGPQQLGGATYSRRILAWGRFADRDDEFAKTLRVLENDRKGRWKVVKSFSNSFDAAFERELFRSRALLIPEMEDFPNGNQAALAAQFKPIAERFLKSGRNIVILGVQEKHNAFLKDAGLIDIKSLSGTVDGTPVTILPAARPFARNVEPSFRARNATYYFVIRPGIPAVPLATTPKGVVVGGRKVGRGWVIVMGMDYYESSEKMKQILFNTLRNR